jgi:cholesterol oxidase
MSGDDRMSEKLDAIVVGSGFGGSIMACRLAEKGMKVLVLERGRRWTPSEYPRKPGDPWTYDTRRPEKRNGWLDLRFFKNMIVAQAAGVGGGSLAYSSVAVEASASCFERGWPQEITYADLKPHYHTAARVMNLQTLPEGQHTTRLELTREAAEKVGHANRFSKMPLAISFSPDWHYGLDDPFDRRHSRTFVNAQGRQQGTCIHLGHCDIGCEVQAKNGLDLTYLAMAEAHGCDVRPLHVVRRLEPQDGGYRVDFERITGRGLVRGDARADRVFLAAGSLGTTELLLRARDEHRTLPKLSRMLGRGWSPNGNVLSMAVYPDRDRVRQSVGPTITSAIDFMDGPAGHRFVVEDDGFPNLLLSALRASVADGAAGALASSVREHLERLPAAKDTLSGVMLWLGAGVDAADGELRLGRHWLPPFRRELDLAWRADASAGVVEAIIAMHRAMTEKTGGRPGLDLGWRLFDSLLTLHPLGGCRMAATSESGVVDHLGQVFGYQNLFVVDGSIVPVPIGRNPSHTIAALAEQIASRVI